MLGRKNFKEKLQQMEMQSKKDRFSIRKLAVGAVSVLLGFSFLGMNSQTARADTVDSGQSSSVASIDKKQAISNTDAAADDISNNSDTVKDNKAKQPELTTFSGLSAFLREDTDEETPASSKPVSKPTETSVPVPTPNQQPVNNGKDQQTEEPVSSDKDQQPAKEPQPVNSGKDQEQAKQPNLLADAAKILQDEVTAGTTFTASDSFKQADPTKQEALNTAIKSGQDLLTKYRALTIATSLESEAHKDDQDKLVSASSNQQPISSTEIVDSGVNQKSLVDPLNTTVTADELTNAAKNIAQAIAEIKSTVEGQADPVISTRANHMDSSGHTTQDQFTWSNWNVADHTVTMQTYTGHDTVVSVPPTITKDNQTYTVNNISHGIVPGGGYVRGCGFNGDYFIRSLTIPGTVKTLYFGTFKLGEDTGNSQLQRFVWEDGGTKITNSNDRLNLELLYCNPHLTYVQLPNTLTTIDVQAGEANAGMPVGIINAKTLTSTLLRINDLDVLFGPGGFNTLYGYTKLNDQSVDPNYYILDVNNQMIAPDVIRYTKKDGTPMPVEVSNVTGATYSNGVFTVNQGVTAITYKATVKMAELGQKDVSINVKLNVRPRVPNVNITTKNISLHTASPTLYSPADTFVSGKDESGNVAQWNSPGMEYMITDSVNRLINADNVINRADTYKTNYSYTYGKDNDQIYDSPLSTATITVYTPKAVKGASASSDVPITAAPKEYISNSNDLTQFNAKYEYVKDINGTPLGGDKPKFTWTPGNNRGQLFVKVSYFKDANQTLADGSEIVPVDMTIIPESTTSANNVIVHHWIKKPDGTLTTTTVPGMSDTYVDGKVNDRVTVSAADTAQKAPNGYTLVTTTDQTSGVITSSGHQEVTFYYKANSSTDANNVIVHHYLQDPAGNPTTTTVPGMSDTRVNGYVGSTVTVKATDHDQKAPAGYTLVTTADQTSGKLTATGNQEVTFYYKGNSSTDTNNVIVHHYLQDPAGNPTTTKVLDDTRVNGYVGSTVTVKAADKDQKAPAGYTLVTTADQTSGKLTATGNQEVTFYYKGNSSTDTNNVIVHHYLQDPAGNPTTTKVLDDTRVNGYVGSTVTVKAADKDQTAPNGYTLVTTADQVSGKLTATGNQEVTFYYKGNSSTDANNVIVHHYLQDPAGNPTTTKVLDDTRVNGYVGSTVTVKAADKDQTAPNGYTLVTTADQTSGKLTATGNQEVTFYYKGNSSTDTNNVIVHHYLQDPQGNPTTTKVLDDTRVNGYVGSTVTVKAADKDQKAPAGYTLVTTADQTSGKLTATGNQEVTFYYKGNSSTDTNNVIVHHYLQDPAGNPTTTKVLDDTRVNGYVGSTVTVKAADKDQTAPNGYTLVTTADQTSGKLTATGNQEVTFYYKGNSSTDTNNVIVHHYLQDPAGNPTTTKVLDDTRVNGYVGSTVTVKAADKDQTAPNGYTLVTTADQTSGKLTATGNQEVTFYYKGNSSTDTNNVIVHHYLQDPAGNPTTTKVLDDTRVNGYVGSTVTIKAADKDQKAPAGYTLVTTADQTSGKLTATGNQEVTFYYKGNSSTDTNNVIVHHYLQDPKGNPTTTKVLDDTRVNGYVGSTVTVKAADKDQTAPNGYTLVTTADQTSGKLTATGNQEVTFYYKGNSSTDTNNVIVHHYLQDPAGNPTTTKVLDDTRVNGYVGSTVTVKAADKDQTAPNGYTLVTTADQTSGKLTATGNQEVTFYYKANSSTDTNNVIVHHYLQDPAGNPTTTTVPGMSDTHVNGYVGSTVTVKAADKDQKAPAGYTLVTTADQTSGKLTATGNQEVTFYYKGNSSTDTNNVIVHHYLQDPAGNPTTTKVLDDTRVNGYVGSTVTVKAADKDQTSPNGYTLVTTADQTSGKLTATGNQEVTFYYKGNSSTDTNNVIVHHYLQDPAGNPTTTKVLDDTRVNGYVGSTVTVKAADKDQTAPNGYTLVTTADQTSGKLTATGNQEVTFYYKGNSSTDTNNVIVHHYLQDPAGNPTTTKVLDDTHVNGYVGSTVTVKAADKDQTAPNGYTLVTTADQVSGKLTVTGNQEVTFYYKGNSSTDTNNVIVHHYLQDLKGNPTTTKVLDDTHVNGYVGSTVTVKAADKDQKAPAGYTLVTTADQTSNKLTATGNQEVTFYYKANSSTDTNNVIVHHYLQDLKGNPTTTTVPGMSDTRVNGYVGSTVTVKATDHDQTAPNGYTLVTTADQTSGKLTATGNQEVTFYYKGNSSTDTNNVIVHHYLQDSEGNPTTTTVPGMSDTHVNGYVGSTVTVKATDHDQTAPNGYTLVTTADQTSGKLTVTGNQEVTFYYKANSSTDANNVIVHHYLQNLGGNPTTTKVLDDTHVNGYVGSTVTVKAADKDQTAPNGYMLVTTADQTSNKLTATGNQEVIFYYTLNTPKVVTASFLQGISLTGDDAKKVISNYDELAGVTGVEWANPNVTSGSGSVSTKIRIYTTDKNLGAYPGGETPNGVPGRYYCDVPVTINIIGSPKKLADNYNPKYSGHTAGWHANLTDQNAIKNLIDYDGNRPTGERYSWKYNRVPNTQRRGRASGTIIITYSDNSTDEVPISFIVR
ncbi:MucBP domain-containing protein [Lactobacillus sp. ESL0791]|uniref:MucBP domain-containing protein n=1 Tax=Lactobacillus sp. ESL0791 TaxID=2983234 RepID=UPI0023F8078A|nr:MucBP domain-containing protein [Lactobacillus sp. ESL0791]MDF7639623.1 MucBP domain-containing protein [Lactobacillus sp. ESL0791]